MLINYKFIKLQPFIRFVDVSATTAAFIRMTVHCQVSTRRTVSSHRCVEVGRTPRLGSLTYPVLSWCVSLLWSTGPFYIPFCCFLCRSPWPGPNLWRGWEKWHGLWPLTCWWIYNLLVTVSTYEHTQRQQACWYLDCNILDHNILGSCYCTTLKLTFNIMTADCILWIFWCLLLLSLHT